MEVTSGDAVVALSATFKCDLINVAFNIVESLLERDLVTGFFLTLPHFKAATVFELDGFLVGGKIAVAYVMWTTRAEHSSFPSLG